MEYENENYDEDDNNSDCDTCEVNEINSIFNKSCNLIEEKQISENKKYILHIDGTSEIDSTIALGTSDSNIDIYTIKENRVAKLDSLEVDHASCIGVKFCFKNSNLLYTGHNNGDVKLWDLRTSKKFVSQFKDSTVNNDSESKQISCFDISPNNRLIAAGTELYEGDAFILFWDVRNTKLMGGYWESHTDDITQTKFHPEDVNKLISASTDGLINVYNLAESCEDDALLDSLNTESSIEQIRWFKNGNVDAVYCVTHTFDVQLWKLEDATPFVEFKRDQLGQTIKRKSEDYSYVAGAHETKLNELFCLVGSNYKDGECLRGLHFSKNNFNPSYNFSENKQRVRGNWFNKNSNMLFTGGEKGILNVWRLDD